MLISKLQLTGHSQMWVNGCRVRRLKKGTSPLRMLPNYEQWVLDLFTHGEYDDYWKQRGYAISQYYEEHADVPTLYLGGWYDSYARATCENYTALSKMKKSAAGTV